MSEALFSCDFSRDELAVLADLLELPALPGLDPEMQAPADAKAAAARGLLARGVVVADATKGTVEITQPYATMLSLVLHADEAQSRHRTDGGVDIRYGARGADVTVSVGGGPVVTWTVVGSGSAGVAEPADMLAQRNGEHVSYTVAVGSDAAGR